MSVTEEEGPIYIGRKTITLNLNNNTQLKYSVSTINQQIVIVTDLSETH